MNLTHLRAFHAVAAAGSFTKGALRLGVSQPALTVQVRALEQRHGVELFRRQGQRIALTPFGERLFQQTRRIFMQLGDVEDLLDAAGALELGKLAIGADGPFSVMALLARFMARHPGVQVAVRIGNATRVRDDLEAGQTDVALLNLVERTADLHSRPLHRDRIVALVPRRHRLAEHPTIRLDALAAAPLILREAGSATRALVLGALEAAGLAPRIALELGSREAVREAVLAGLGIGTVFVRELVPHGGLLALEVEGTDLVAEVSIACLPERRELGTVRAFFRIAGVEQTPPSRPPVSR
jgi:aminoethylphosphonate catabolism LysR family transcriptional regulator